MSGTQPGDRVAAYLAEAGEAVTQRDELLPRMPVSVTEFNAAQDRLAEHAPRLLAAVEAALGVAGKHEHGATRWENPLPVPAWIPELREAISRELLGEGETGG